jgi:hypothetical protein
MKTHVNTTTFLLILITVLSSCTLVNPFEANNKVLASTDDIKFSEADFMIKDFGIDGYGNPFLTVEGRAGATIPQKENTGYAYVFVTNNGTFSVSSDWMYTKWHTHELKLDEKNCVESMNMDARVGADVGDTVKVINANATKLDKVMTVEFTINDNDGSFCATKIFDSLP